MINDFVPISSRINGKLVVCPFVKNGKASPSPPKAVRFSNILSEIRTFEVEGDMLKPRYKSNKRKIALAVSTSFLDFYMLSCIATQAPGSSSADILFGLRSLVPFFSS